MLDTLQYLRNETDIVFELTALLIPGATANGGSSTYWRDCNEILIGRDRYELSSRDLVRTGLARPAKTVAQKLPALSTINLVPGDPGISQYSR